LNRIQVVPITSKVSKIYPCEAPVELKGELRKTMADQITTVSKSRVKSKLGTLSREDMQAVEQAIRVQLAIVSQL
jgi:mRNA interferase MazF